MSSNDKPRYDADWLTLLVAKVHQITGYTPEVIIRNMSLNEVCYYFVQYVRLNGDPQNIYRRSPEEICKLIEYRTCEIVCERLVEVGTIHEEEKQKYIDIMLKNPNIDAGVKTDEENK